MEQTAGKLNQQSLQDNLHVQQHIWKNMGTATRGGIMDIYCGHKINSKLCHHSVVPKSYTENKQDEMSKVQWMAGLGITATMRTAPKAAIKVHLRLPPMHLQVKQGSTG
jgi:hypothetical protein